MFFFPLFRSFPFFLESIGRFFHFFSPPSCMCLLLRLHDDRGSRALPPPHVIPNPMEWRKLADMVGSHPHRRFYVYFICFLAGILIAVRSETATSRLALQYIYYLVVLSYCVLDKCTKLGLVLLLRCHGFADAA